LTRYAIGLGSNLGDRLANLRIGVSGLRSLGEVTALSSVYGTEPIGGPAQGAYLNAVALVETDLEPSALLVELAVIEEGAGRVREERWGPRTLDLDILVSDFGEISTERLVVPHPRVGEREFALRPLAEVWPEAPLGAGVTAGDALARIGGQGVAYLASAWESESTPVLGKALVAVQMIWIVATAVAMAWDGSLPEGEVSPTRVVGFVLAILGAALAFVASRRLGPGLSPAPEPRDGIDLVQTGPYALVRHPIYGGVTLFVLGTALIVDSVAGSLLAVGLGAFFYLKSEYEERRLLLRYPAYHRYREKVPRRLIPFLL
jgi:2-amino-4-hydroxy-6-hydroxymethyldihydropteridine diphosphokinase